MAATFSVSPISNAFNFPYSSSKIHKPTFSLKPPTINFTTFTYCICHTSSGENQNNGVEFNGQDSSISSESLLRTSEAIKAPTAPWMKGPLLLEPSQILDLSSPRIKKGSTFGKNENPDKALSGKLSGRGKKAMKKIFQGIEKLQELKISDETPDKPEKFAFKFLPGDLWGEDNSEIENVGPQKNLEKAEVDLALVEGEGEVRPKFCARRPWERDEKMVFARVKERVVTAAELNLDRVLLERLRGEAVRTRSWVKVKKAGVTQAVIDQIHLIWKTNELAMLKFDLPLCRNMDRAREIVEMKTGGFVVWIKKDALVVYRGTNYSLKFQNKFVNDHESSSLNVSRKNTVSVSQASSNVNNEMSSRIDGEEESPPINGSLFEREADRLLDDLGPRFVDWWQAKPLPVDGDLLPEVVPGFKPPFRLCPPRVRSKLTDDELTSLRKLARSLPTHFVLGRNRNLQGLATAIIKLWEKCLIAKIAVKMGTPNTDNEQMADELKCLTGGVLLLRNKFLIILYRGKDFLPSRVAKLVAERETELKKCQLQEEFARFAATGTLSMMGKPSLNSGASGTLKEFRNISESTYLRSGSTEVEIQLQTDKERLEKELRNQERKFFILKKKIEKSVKKLALLNAAWRPAERDRDQEIITQEERECLRRIGLTMDRSLVLGRRGVFDGVIEGMHQHWKHREVVKVITRQRMFSQVMRTAALLEVESGGLLVSVDKIKEGHAMIFYRGKNYRRPRMLPQNLLNKKEALERSLEMQRLGSLKFFASQRELAISDIKCKLAAVCEKN